jgi:hypothetical protein
VPVHVVDAVDPLWVIVQTGSPFLLKCGLCALATLGSASTATAARANNRRYRFILFILPSVDWNY